MIAATVEPLSSSGLLSLDERAARLLERRHELDLEEVLWCREAAALVATDYYDEQGFATPQEWLRISCHLTRAQASERVAVGTEIHSMPESLQALLAGEVGYGHVAAMAKTAHALRDSKTAARFDETMVLDKARESTVGRLYRDCEHLRHALDAAGYAAAEAETVEARSLEISGGGDGFVSIKGFFDAAGAAVVRNALEPLARPLAADDRRDRRRRMADALIELAGGARPAQLQVTASVETLLGLAGAPAGDMPFSLPISSTTVERIACDCNVVRVLLDGSSTVIDVGRSTPKVSPAMRRALNARDGGCRWPGCDRPVCWSQAHHFHHWTDGGETKLDNLVLLCYHHHRNVHEGGWQLVKRDDGSLLAIPPPTRFRPWSRGPD